MTSKNFIALSLALLLTACFSPSTLKTAQLEAAKQNAVLMLPLYINPRNAADVQSEDTKDLCLTAPQKIHHLLSKKMRVRIFGNAHLEDGYCRVLGEKAHEKWSIRYLELLDRYIAKYENAEFSEKRQNEWHDIMGYLFLTIATSTYLEESDIRELNDHSKDYMSGKKCYKDACYIIVSLLYTNVDVGLGLVGDIGILWIIDVRNGDIIFTDKEVTPPSQTKSTMFEDIIPNIP